MLLDSASPNALDTQDSEMVSSPRRGEVWLIDFRPVVGLGNQEDTPLPGYFPEEMNEPLETALVAPMTTTLRSYTTRLNLNKYGASRR
jgi:mRNA-degrading endonuclease toxin of MazEF toxin-antitoxin module